MDAVTVRLSPRQAAVLAAVSDGVPLTVAARRLGTTREQVSARLSEAYRRLEVAWLPRDERRAEAVRVARLQGLIPREGVSAPQAAQKSPNIPDAARAESSCPENAPEGP